MTAIAILLGGIIGVLMASSTYIKRIADAAELVADMMRKDMERYSK